MGGKTVAPAVPRCAHTGGGLLRGSPRRGPLAHSAHSAATPVAGRARMARSPAPALPPRQRTARQPADRSQGHGSRPATGGSCPRRTAPQSRPAAQAGAISSCLFPCAAGEGAAASGTQGIARLRASQTCKGQSNVPGGCPETSPAGWCTRQCMRAQPPSLPARHGARSRSPRRRTAVRPAETRWPAPAAARGIAAPRQGLQGHRMRGPHCGRL